MRHILYYYHVKRAQGDQFIFVHAHYTRTSIKSVLNWYPKVLAQNVIKIFFRYIEAEKQFLLINLKSKQMIGVVQELNRHSRLEETIQGKPGLESDQN